MLHYAACAEKEAIPNNFLIISIYCDLYQKSNIATSFAHQQVFIWSDEVVY